jgi:hypothetical protein
MSTILYEGLRLLGSEPPEPSAPVPVRLLLRHDPTRTGNKTASKPPAHLE